MQQKSLKKIQNILSEKKIKRNRKVFLNIDKHVKITMQN